MPWNRGSSFVASGTPPTGDSSPCTSRRPAPTLLEDATPARTAAIVELMSDLTGEQRARLARLCRRLLRTLDPAETERESEAEAAADAGATTPEEHAAVTVASSATASDSTHPST